LLLRRYSDSLLLQAHPPPSYHKLISQRILVIELTFSSNFLPGQVGLLQLLSMSLLPCCLYHPAGIRQTYIGQFSFAYTAFASKLQALASRVFRLRGRLCVYFRLRPGNLLITPKMTLRVGFQRFGYPPPCYPSHRASGFYPDRTVSC